MKSVSDAIREAQRRLEALGIPTDPDARWTGIDYSGDIDAQVAARIDQTNMALYDVITYGCRALVTRADGDWDGYTEALWTMFGADISSNITQIAGRFLSERQGNFGSKDRSDVKQLARQLYGQGKPESAKALLQLIIESGLAESPPKLKNVQTWFTEFKNSR